MKKIFMKKSVIMILLLLGATVLMSVGVSADEIECDLSKYGRGGAKVQRCADLRLENMRTGLSVTVANRFADECCAPICNIFIAGQMCDPNADCDQHPFHRGPTLDSSFSSNFALTGTRCRCGCG